MNIKSAKVIPGCISCKNCENICPEIFKLTPKSEVISDKFNENAIKLLMAEKMCPVQVIQVEKEGNVSLENKTARLQSKQYLTPDTLELVFETENFSFIPGQYISLQMRDIRGEFSRSYSIASGNKKSFTLTVKLLDTGRGSNYLRKLSERNISSFFRKNTKIEYLGPFGDFTLQDTPSRKTMIATGTGLSPMISMLEALSPETKKLLIFGGRYEQDLYYFEKLKSFENLELIRCVSRPHDEYKGEIGRVTDYLYHIHPEDEVYICGNPDMVHDTIAHLRKIGHFSEKIFHEDFTLASKPDSLLKIFFFEGNIPGVNFVQNFLIYSGLIAVPIIYFLSVYYNFLGTPFLGTTFYTLLFDLSWYTVVSLMLIRPLADIFPKLGIFRRLVVLRKGLGIFSASVIVTLLLSKWILNPATFFAFFQSFNWGLWYPLLSRLSEVTAIILLVTSNTFSQKMLGIWWKRIQKTSYIYFVSGGIVAAQWSPDKLYYEAMIVVGVVWLVAQLGIKVWK